MIEIKRCEGAEFLDVIENGERLASIWPGSRVEEPMARLVYAYNKVEGFDKKVDALLERYNTDDGYYMSDVAEDLKEYFYPKPQMTVGNIKRGKEFTILNIKYLKTDERDKIGRWLCVCVEGPSKGIIAHFAAKNVAEIKDE